MKIKIKYISSCKSLKARRCKICNKLFVAYNNGKNICSNSCQKVNNTIFQRNKILRIKKDPVAIYKHRKSIIEQREKTRKDNIRKDLPFIKDAMARGEECLIDYIFNHYAQLHSKRTYKKN